LRACLNTNTAFTAFKKVGYKKCQRFFAFPKLLFKRNFSQQESFTATTCNFKRLNTQLISGQKNAPKGA